MPIAELPQIKPKHRWTKVEAQSAAQNSKRARANRKLKLMSNAALAVFEAHPGKVDKQEKVDDTIAQAIEFKSNQVRSLLSVEAVKQAEALALTPNSDAGTFKTVVDAADKLFGWSKVTGPSSLVQNNYLAEIAPQAVVSCGVTEPVQVNITSEHSPSVEPKH